MRFTWQPLGCALFTSSSVFAATGELPRATHEQAVVPLFGDAPAALGLGSVLARSSVTFASGASGAIRPMMANQISENAVLESTGWVGVGRNLALTFRGISDRLPFDAAGHSGSMLGISWVPTATHHHQLSISSGYMREFSGAQGIWMRVSTELKTNHLVLTSTAHSERVFVPGRDAIDVVFMTGCYYQVNSILRLGAEYVGQDLEGLFNPEELEGLRQFAGPVIALNDPVAGFGAIAGPAWGIAGGSSLLVTRVAAVLAF